MFIPSMNAQPRPYEFALRSLSPGQLLACFTHTRTVVATRLGYQFASRPWRRQRRRHRPLARRPVRRHSCRCPRSAHRRRRPRRHRGKMRSSVPSFHMCCSVFVRGFVSSTPAPPFRSLLPLYMITDMSSWFSPAFTMCIIIHSFICAVVIMNYIFHSLSVFLFVDVIVCDLLLPKWD